MPSNTDDTSHNPVTAGGAPAPGYETRDANTNAVLLFLVFLFLVVTATLFVTWRLFRHFDAAETEPAPASSFSDVRQLPAAPELQVNSRQDLLETQARQRQELETYSWEDRDAGIVRIPIERAIDLLLQKGLPVVPSGAGREAESANAGRESNDSGSVNRTANQRAEK